MHQLSRHLRAAASITAILATSAMLSGCSSNFDSPVLAQYDQAVGINERTGDIYALDVLVVADEEGNGTLVGALLNKTEEDDQLVAVSTQGSDIKVPTPDKPLPLPPETLVQLAEVEPISLSGNGLQAGEFIPLSLQFDQADTISAQVPVVSHDGPYADVPIETAE